MRSLLNTVRDFQKREEGTTAVIFGLSLFVVFFSVGFALDSARAYQAAEKAATALDSATLAAAKAMREQSLTDAQITQVAQQFFDANIVHAGLGAATFKPLTVTVDRANGRVTADVPGEVVTTFVRIAGPGFDKLAFTKTSTATFSLQDVEVGLMLDVTGSMGAFNKINDMKSAVALLADTLIPTIPGPGSTKIGLAPFSGAVNLGNAYAKIASGNRSADGCVIERLNAVERLTDDAPASGLFGVQGDMNSNGAYVCPTAKVLPLTNDKATIINTVNTYSPGGCTAGHLGVTWAWNLISPNWNTVWPAASAPAPYGDGKTLKVVILMTDGLFNSAYVNGGSNCTDGNPVSPDLAIQMCNSMRAKGVAIYTVGLRLSLAGPAAVATLQACAGDPARALLAENGQELKDAFQNIAIQLNNLRLSK